MGSQRTYATIKERIDHAFKTSTITPDKSYKFFRGLYPMRDDIVVPIEVIAGMLNFIREEITMEEIEYEDIGIVNVDLTDNICILSYAITLGNFEAKIHNYRYTHTTIIDIHKNGKITTVTNKNYKDNKFYIDRCAETLINILTAVYNWRWHNG